MNSNREIFMYIPSKNEMFCNEHGIWTGKIDQSNSDNQCTYWHDQITVNGNSKKQVENIIKAICDTLNFEKTQPFMNNPDVLSVRYAEFVLNLEKEIRKAGGVGIEIFEKEELAKMMRVFANNNISIAYNGRSE